MKISITGGSGFLGRHLIRHFESLGHEVTAWQRPDGGSIASPTARVIPGSLDDADSAAQLCEGQDALIHACVDTPGERFVGGEGDPTQYFQTNVVGSMRLIDAARKAGCQTFRFHQQRCCSRANVAQGRLGRNSSPLAHVSIYGSAKASIETIIHATGWEDSEPEYRCLVNVRSLHAQADKHLRYRRSDRIVSLFRLSSVGRSG